MLGGRAAMESWQLREPAVVLCERVVQVGSRARWEGEKAGEPRRDVARIFTAELVTGTRYSDSSLVGWS